MYAFPYEIAHLLRISVDHFIGDIRETAARPVLDYLNKIPLRLSLLGCRRPSPARVLRNLSPGFDHGHAIAVIAIGGYTCGLSG